MSASVPVSSTAGLGLTAVHEEEQLAVRSGRVHVGLPGLGHQRGAVGSVQHETGRATARQELRPAQRLAQSRFLCTVEGAGLPGRRGASHVFVMDEELHRVDQLVHCGDPGRGPQRGTVADGVHQRGPRLGGDLALHLLRPPGEQGEGDQDAGCSVGPAFPDHEVGGQVTSGPLSAQGRRIGTGFEEEVAEQTTFELSPVRHGSKLRTAGGLSRWAIPVRYPGGPSGFDIPVGRAIHFCWRCARQAALRSVRAGVATATRNSSSQARRR